MQLSLRVNENQSRAIDPRDRTARRRPASRRAPESRAIPSRSAVQLRTTRSPGAPGEEINQALRGVLETGSRLRITLNLPERALSELASNATTIRSPIRVGSW